MKEGMTLGLFLERQQQFGISESLTSIVEALATATIEIADRIHENLLFGFDEVETKINVQGEQQKSLDVLANDIVLTCCKSLPQVSYAVSEELRDAVHNSDIGEFAVIFDPLDGSSNVDLNVTVGSIFSIIPARTVSELFQSGASQVFAAYVAYGPSTCLTLTFGTSVSIFVADSDRCYRLVTEDAKMQDDFAEYSINSSRRKEWPEGVSRYIEDCELGESGPLRRRYNMRWVGSMVAEFHRIVLRGGIFIYPATKDGGVGKLRLLYEANPMSLIAEVAGGRATTGDLRILDVRPSDLHERIGVIIGSRKQVESISSYISMSKAVG